MTALDANMQRLSSIHDAHFATTQLVLHVYGFLSGKHRSFEL